MQIRDAGYGDDRADARLPDLNSVKSLKLIELAYPDPAELIRLVMVDYGALPAYADEAVVHLAHTDTSYIFIVVDRADEQLEIAVRVARRCRDILDDRIKERRHIHVVIVQTAARPSAPRACVDKRALKLAVAGIEIHQQLQHLVLDLRAACLRSVTLVDAAYDVQIQLQRLLQDELGLGHDTLRRIDDQYDAVDHLEHTLHLAAEIGMSGRVDDVDLRALVVDGGVFREYGDTPLTLYIIGVHDTIHDLLMLVECAALAQQLIHQRGLAVIDMGYDCYISDSVICDLHKAPFPLLHL